MKNSKSLSSTKILRVIFLMVYFFVATGCDNILSEFADPETDEALHFEAKRLMNKSKWAEALLKFDEMSAEYLAKREVIYDHAGAYAGLCGLDFLQMVEDLGGGASRLFALFMQSNVGATSTQVDACKAAEAKIKEINTDPNSRTLDENLLMAFVGFTKVGTILALYADTDADGTADWGHNDSCLTTNISDEEVQHVATGLTNALSSLNAVAAESSIGSDATTDLTSICSEPSVTFCSDTQTTDIDANEIKAMRTLIQEGQAVGLGTCTGGPPNDITNCVCL